PEAQVALVAMDPQTGEIKALIGGRNYGASQLNRSLAKRQPGSAFKPFVYAAALNTALQGSARVVTPASTLVDEPTTFWFDNKPYEPNNFKSQFRGLVTVRQALAHSMNIPTVKLAEMVGYGAVQELAKRAGMNYNIQATPAIALGAYEVTPIEVAGAYTVFANQGTFARPNWIKYIRDDRGQGIYENKPLKRQVLDPRVAYLMVDLLEEVLRSGTGAGVRSRGFNLPAAGKTGTSHDGWFAGFTSKLICVVWVGFDNNEELHLEGAHTALPIWAEFMKKAAQYREYRNPKAFEPPDGIVSVEIDPTSGELATLSCPSRRPEEFVSGTQPIAMCHVHGGGGSMQVAGWETQPVQPSTGAAPATATAAVQSGSEPGGAVNRPPMSVAIPAQQPQQQPGAPQETSKKKGLFGRIRDIFR
ncbi:MAG: penicillin-binding transpeptidase domain-containing protein, partial [Acidobacteria bacterium]|nr:penicillin-binding transpeptidase domain-containing protein [Acidobacteriota bacterium]